MRTRLTFVVGLLGFMLYTASCDSTESSEPRFGFPVDIPLVDSWPDWHPNGRIIAFMDYGVVSFLDAEMTIGVIDPMLRGLWFINADGTQARHILKAEDISEDFTEFPQRSLWELTSEWSPDGNWIVLDAGAQIYKLRMNEDDVDKTSLEQLTMTKGQNFFPQWSPDGNWIIYESNADSSGGPMLIWKMKTDGTEKQRLVSPDETYTARYPAWSPDGKQIIHVRHSNEGQAIFVMDADGQNPIPLTEIDNLVVMAFPRFSPDGQWIAYHLDNEAWLMDASGGRQRQLTYNTTPGPRYTSWSPDGTQLVYVGDHNTLWIMDLEGKPYRRLTYRPEPEATKNHSK